MSKLWETLIGFSLSLLKENLQLKRPDREVKKSPQRGRGELVLSFSFDLEYWRSNMDSVSPI